jgi:ketosteroid isomerase-like protein
VNELSAKASAAYGAWNADDLEGWLANLHPDFRLYSSGVFPGLDEIYEGREGATQYWWHVREPFEWLRMEYDRLVERGDRAAARLHFRARGRGSGAETDLTFAHAARFEDGLVIELWACPSYEEALQIAGLAR